MIEERVEEKKQNWRYTRINITMEETQARDRAAEKRIGAYIIGTVATVIGFSAMICDIIGVF